MVRCTEYRVSGNNRGGDTPGPMPNPAVKPSIADGTTKGIRGRVGHRQNILKKGVSGFPEAPFFAKLPKGHRREVRQEDVARSGGEAVV